MTQQFNPYEVSTNFQSFEPARAVRSPSLRAFLLRGLLVGGISGVMSLVLLLGSHSLGVGLQAAIYASSGLGCLGMGLLLWFCARLVSEPARPWLYFLAGTVVSATKMIVGAILYFALVMSQTPSQIAASGLLMNFGIFTLEFFVLGCVFALLNAQRVSIVRVALAGLCASAVSIVGVLLISFVVGALRASTFNNGPYLFVSLEHVRHFAIASIVLWWTLPRGS